MKLKRVLKGFLAVGLLAAGAQVITAQPAAAATYITRPIYSVISVQANTPRVMAVLNASTGDNAPMVHAPYTNPAPYNDIMVLEIESDQVVRIKPRHTFSDDGNPHNDKCLAIRNNDARFGEAIVSATCTYDATDNDVWVKDQYIVIGPGGSRYEAFTFHSLAYPNLCIRVGNPSTNDRLVTDYCTSDGASWRWPANAS